MNDQKQQVQTEKENGARPAGGDGTVSEPPAIVPRRPALRYWGGKWRLGKHWIVPILRGIEHEHFIDAFGGGASVTLQMPPTGSSYRQTYNDLDGEVVNFFRVLREHPTRLIRAIRLTPFSRAEWEQSYQEAGDSDSTAGRVEAARRFYVRAWQSFGSSGLRKQDTEWRAEKKAKRGSSVISGWNDTDNLHDVADRLKNVQLEKRDALELIPAYDFPGALFYVDPPYLLSTRSRKGYSEEMASADDHTELANVLRAAEGAVVISGYPSELYEELYTVHGWEKRTRSSQVGAPGEQRTECLWLNPTAQRCRQQQNLFD
jgi:DNA adenine methylase